MLLREDADGLIAISQPAHAWIAGQLARNWGNEFFGSFAPREEVCLATALHDIGYLNWEQAPELNLATGLPHCFLDMPRKTQLQLWTKSVQKLMRYGRYPALLVSLHFTRLCQNHRKFNSPAEFEIEKAFLNEQESFQATLQTSLQNDYFYGPCVVEEILTRNHHLMAAWDWLSLSFCLGFGSERTIADVPTATGKTAIKLVKKESNRIGIEPWPFATGERGLRLVCEGRRLHGKFTDEVKMREALRAGAPVTLQFELERV